MHYDTIKHIAMSNQEKLGKQLLHKGCLFIAKGNFEAAFSYINDGYELLTCDCLRDYWFEDTYNQRDKIIEFSKSKLDEPEFYFCMAFALFFISMGERGNEHDVELRLKSLKLINNYLELKPCSLGMYLKGRILAFSKQVKESIDCFNKSFQLKPNTPSLYRAAGVRQTLEEDSLYGLYRACLNNPSSICAWEKLHDFAVIKKGIRVSTDKINGRICMLARHFNSERLNTFSIALSEIFRKPKLSHPERYFRAFEAPTRTTENDEFVRHNYEFSSVIHSGNLHLQELQDFVAIMSSQAHLFNEPLRNRYRSSSNSDSEWEDANCQGDDENGWGGDISGNPYYNDDLDMDQQSQEFWDNL